MAYINIENFKFGLDVRRSELTSLPGTLMLLNNCHINEGGEIEKRKAIVRTLLPTGTFGLEATDAGLITFGSVADPGGWPISGVAAYQRLQHPSVLVGVGYNATYHAMTEVVTSECFSGKAFVVAKFADGKSFFYFNGSLVTQSSDGQVLFGITRAMMATQVVNGITANGWTVTQPSSPLVGDSGAGFMQFESPSAVTFTNVNTVTSAAGYLSLFETPGSGAGSAAVRAVATVTVTGIGSVNDVLTIVAPSAANGTGSVTLFNTPRNAGWTTTALFAGAIVNFINYIQGATGYTATLSGSDVIIHAPLSFGSTINTHTLISVTPGGTITVSGSPYTFSGGVTAVPAYGDTGTAYFFGTWAVGDSWSVSFAATDGDFTLGKGNVSGSSPTCCVVFSGASGAATSARVYLGLGNNFNFCAIGDPTGWEEQNVGAGFIAYTSQVGATDTVNGFSGYQGRLAVFGRRSIQLWVTDADPTKFALQQTLENIGTLSPLSVKSIGALETIFLADSGLRSLRVRDSSLNAYVSDLGSPIDDMVKPTMLNIASTTLALSCGGVEPVFNRYWVYVNTGHPTTDKIYVLSYFPGNKIIAWATYDPVSSAGDTFVPQKFVVYNGQLYIRDATSVSVYGGSNNATYDATQCEWQVPYLAGGGKQERPGHFKAAKGVDLVLTGTWTISAGMDPISETLEEIDEVSEETYEGGTIGYSANGTHFSIKGTSTSASAAKVSSVMFHYELSEETA